MFKQHLAKAPRFIAEQSHAGTDPSPLPSQLNGVRVKIIILYNFVVREDFSMKKSIGLLLVRWKLSNVFCFSILVEYY